MTMPHTTTFIRLLAADDKPAALRAATAAHRAATTPPFPRREGGLGGLGLFTLDPASFRQIPGSPFAYWVSEDVRRLFTELPPFEGDGREARRGSSTGDDFQRVRTWWEVLPITVSWNIRWATFAKGGSYSPFYYDMHLLADWDESRHTYRNFYGRPGREIERPEALDYYFRPGLTYPRRTQGGFSVRVMPAGCIFADKGPALFVSDDEPTDLLALLAMVNSASFGALLSMQMAFGSYEVGVVQRTPVPDLSADDAHTLATLAREAHDCKRESDRDDEVTHPFTVPALVRLRAQPTLAAALSLLANADAARVQRLATIQREIDDRCYALYGFSPDDRAHIEASSPPAEVGAVATGDEAGDDRDEERDAQSNANAGNGLQRARTEAANLIMYALGCAFGRWDVRIAHDPTLAPRLADPFAPLPVCAPGALVGHDGLPATRDHIASEAWLRTRPNAITLPDPTTLDAPSTPPSLAGKGAGGLGIAWDGILVDDPDAPNDLLRRIRLVLDHLWGDRASAIEAEACALLGVRDLREYLRNPRLFFDFHISRYSKSRRKAPIYWLLQSPKRHYAIWLYYHRLDADLIFKALTLHLLPKIRLEEQRLDELHAAKAAAGPTGPEARRAAQALDRQETLLADLREFHDALDRAARHYLTPDLNDGVLLNIAPFCEVIPWKEAKAAWQQLLTGKYDWSSIGQQLRAKGYVKGK
ncbi:MAG: hypothetical protein OJF49_001784 [Ktedonobacterales bacterium]|jgi:hypothetical protein|nr:MAG: hypothetical protein OJF49_001784 [Ktedonobacterales bacterium]